MNSKVGLLARKRHKFLIWSEWPLLMSQDASEDRKFVAKLKQQHSWRSVADFENVD